MIARAPRAAGWAAGLSGLVVAASIACTPPRTAMPSVSPPASSAVAAATTASATPAPPAFCVEPAFRESELASAWSEGDRTVVCVRPQDPDAGPPERSCVELQSSGVYGAASRIVPAERPAASEPFRPVSGDGLERFEIVGGGLHPHSAMGILRDARNGRILKQAPIAYDEHVDALGWIGRDVVLRERVDEGPGCVLRLVDPQRTWPVSMQDDGDAGLPFVDCFDGNLLLRPSAGTVALVDAGGASVTFVDEATMSVDVVDTRHSGGPERGRRFAGWIEGGSVLVMAYGAPESGVVARIDLARRALLGVWSPPTCSRSASPSAPPSE
jgi:hypothetical protein